MRKRILLILLIILIGNSCTQKSPSLPLFKPISQEMDITEQLKIRGFEYGSPIYIRIFKEENILEIWIKKKNKKYGLFQTYPICKYSGTLGPKLHEGDRQAPEGFYAVTANQLNPYSAYHLSFNLGYPNAYDKAHGLTGRYLMVHGDCRSIGCYAMGDAQIEDIYSLVEIALNHGQQSVPVHIYPFRMTPLNLQKHKTSPWYNFWKMLEPAYVQFEKERVPPIIVVTDMKYQIIK